MLPDHSGVRDYDIATLDGGHLLVMLNNAEMDFPEANLRCGSRRQRPRESWSFPNRKDRWYPPNTPPAFVAIVAKESTPTDQELIAAIQAQFDCVLKRRAD